MARGLFIGLTEDELLAIRNKAVTAITAGLNVVSYSDSGSSVSKQWALPPKEMLDEAGYALYGEQGALIASGEGVHQPAFVDSVGAGDSFLAGLVLGLTRGQPLEEALRRFSLRMPLPEVRLFVTVLTMQARSGGGLSEALSNLSTVLRARRKLRLRIKAMSSEAKSSALIIGALPIILGLVLHFASPNYIALLFTHPVGNTVLWACGAWMLIGMFVMRRMIDLRV